MISSKGVDQRFIALSFAFAFWFLGLGSFAYHAYNTSYTVFLDYAGANLLLANMASTTLIQFVSVELDWRFLAFIRVLSVVAATTVGIVVSVLRQRLLSHWQLFSFLYDATCIVCRFVRDYQSVLDASGVCCRDFRFPNHPHGDSNGPANLWVQIQRVCGESSGMADETATSRDSINRRGLYR